MSRSPVYETPVEEMSIEDLTENALTIYKSIVFEMSHDELEEENIRFGVAHTPHPTLAETRQQIVDGGDAVELAEYDWSIMETCEECNSNIIPKEIDEVSIVPENGFCLCPNPENLVYILITEDGGIPEITMISKDEEKVKQLWHECVMDESGGGRECDMAEMMASTSYDRGYFLWHKTEYRITVEEVV